MTRFLVSRRTFERYVELPAGLLLTAVVAPALATVVDDLFVAAIVATIGLLTVSNALGRCADPTLFLGLAVASVAVAGWLLVAWSISTAYVALFVLLAAAALARWRWERNRRIAARE